MEITFHPLRGSAATTAIRDSRAFDPAARVHLRFVEPNDVHLVYDLTPDLSLADRRRWLQEYKSREAQGEEFNFIVVENGRDAGLVCMNDFGTIGGEASFRWGDFVSHQPGLITATALTIYSLGFDALGYARAHLTVSRSEPALSAFHLSTGADLEFADGDHSYYRFGSETYDKVRSEVVKRRTAPVS